MTSLTRFKLTKKHIKLLRQMYVDWQDCETGAPAIDPKRPYGNSDVENDIHQILTGESIGRVSSKRDELTEKERIKYRNLHAETEIALQIVLVTGKFKPGWYECEEYTKDWKLKK
jgi:hypothetical protein